MVIAISGLKVASSWGGDEIHGVSLHHDHRALGAEENYKAEYRRLKRDMRKDMGVNAHPDDSNPA